jgi:hypothetical protein
MYCLRQHLVAAGLDVLITALPIVCKGSVEDLNAYAVANGYTWRPNHTLLFGGYYANKSGDCLYPDLYNECAELPCDYNARGNGYTERKVEPCGR